MAGNIQTPRVGPRSLLFRGVVITIIGWVTALASLGMLMLVFVKRVRLDSVVSWVGPSNPLAHAAVFLAFVAFLVVLVAVPVAASTLPATQWFWRMGAGRMGLIAAWAAWLLLSLAGWAGSMRDLLHVVAEPDPGFGEGLLMAFLIGILVLSAVVVPLLVRTTLLTERARASRAHT